MQNKHTEAYVAGKKYQKIKLHIQQNKTAYAIGGSCFAVGFIGGLLIRRPIEVNVVNLQR
jgi:hypothetical protein